MPIDITQGNIANFSVEFLDSSSNLAVPSGGAITLTYTDNNGNPATSLINLVNSGTGVFTGSWSSSVASLGSVSYTVSCSSTATVDTGLFQVVN